MADPIQNQNQEVIVVSKERVQKLTEDTLKVVNKRIAERIVNTIDDESDANHTPSAAAVNTAIKSIKHFVDIIVPSGDPADAPIEPNETTLYMVRKAVTDTLATPYIWKEDTGYVNAGGEGGGIDIGVITEEEIDDAVDAADEATKPVL